MIEIMKSKRSQTLLGEHGVELVIAVLCIVVLVFLGFMVYNFFIGEKAELAQARATLDEVMGSIKSLEIEGDNREISLINPTDWALSYQHDLEKRPGSCGGESCLCICKYSSNEEKFFDNCNSEANAVCENYDKHFIEVGPLQGTFKGMIDILKVTKIKISLIDNRITIKET